MFTVKTELQDELYLDVSFAWDRTRRPVENADGIVPEQDDFKILVGLRYDY
jgi:long-subunit fatty acid transport protein